MFKDYIKAEIEVAIARREVIDYRAITNVVIERIGGYNDIRNVSELFAQAVYERVLSESKSVVNAIKRSAIKEITNDVQLSFEPMYLQSHYGFGDRATPIEMMLRDEFDEKITEHRSQGMGHLQHALELERYMFAKFGGEEGEAFESSEQVI